VAPSVQVRWARARIDALAADLCRAAEADGTARRLQTVPGIGPIAAGVPAATVPDVSAFRSALASGRSDRWRDPLAPLSARFGRTPRPQSSGGQERPGAIPTTGNRSIRRRLCLGAMGVISTRRRTDPGEDWPGEMLRQTPPKVGAIALANRMARPEPGDAAKGRGLAGRVTAMHSGPCAA
jgi:transposase